MVKMHIEATEAPHCTLATGHGENSLFFLRFFVFFNLAQFHHIFLLFAQVMVSKASVTNYEA